MICIFKISKYLLIQLQFTKQNFLSPKKMFVHFLLPLLCLNQAEGLKFHISELSSEKIFFDLAEAKELFNDFIEYFGKNYVDLIEYNKRLEIFTRNLEDVNNRNRRSESEVYGITPFLDLTIEEFVSNHTGFKADFVETLSAYNSNETLSFATIKDIPDHWDWRKHGVVTPVKDQKTCGSCWTFSSIGCVEGQHAIKHKKLHVLSEQQVLDCSGGGHCKGGFPELALQGMAKTAGFVAGSDYPYVDRQQVCRTNKAAKILAKVKGGKRILVASEEHLKKLVYQYGPVPVAITALHGFMKYRNDIATPQNLGCHPNFQVNHAVLLVGYGTENGKPYWIIKNSHGQSWGDEGYMRILRNVNACNILAYVVTADVL